MNLSRLFVHGVFELSIDNLRETFCISLPHQLPRACKKRLPNSDLAHDAEGTEQKGALVPISRSA
jgi:hypothetical protein